MILDRSTPLGQRASQVKQEAQSQIVFEEAISSSKPNCASRIIWLGSTSIAKHIGQPAEHLPH